MPERRKRGALGGSGEEEQRRAAGYGAPKERARNVTLYMPPEAYQRLDEFTRRFIGEHARTSISEVAQQAIAMALEEHRDQLEERLMEAARLRGRG